MLRQAKYQLKLQLKSFRKDFDLWRRFWKSYDDYGKLLPAEPPPALDDLYPCIYDATGQTPMEPTYFYQDTWAFEHIVKQKPQSHIDVGSFYLFVSFLSKVMPVTMVDIRPLELPLETLTFKQGSILELPFEDNSIHSLSCLCVIEHIGLGRYGDPLDPHGSEKAVKELCRILAPGGKLYFSVPVGDRDVTAFNAGRIFTLQTLAALLLPLQITEQQFIVGRKLQNYYEPSSPFGTTGLFVVTKPNQ
ncbi:MAG: DUF268 domain-containing protein [Rhizobacter sp.]|nr:DUF268 domain-containing protein [Chlorobiales bacterium]